MATKRIIVQFQARGATKVQAQIKGIGTRAGVAATAVKQLKVALAGFIGIQAIKAIIGIADEIQNLRNRLKVLIPDASTVPTLLDEIFEAANRSRVGVTEFGDTLTRLEKPLQRLGESQLSIVRITETLSKALILSGTTSEEAGRALVQLGQAFNLGVLRGQDFNSIASQAPVILDLISKSTGRSVAELKKLGSEGKLTANVLRNAFKNGAKEIDKAFEDLPLTVGQSLTILRNNFKRLVGDIDSAFGVSGTLAKGIKFVADLIDGFRKDVILLSAAITVLKETFGEAEKSQGSFFKSLKKNLEDARLKLVEFVQSNTGAFGRFFKRIDDEFEKQVEASNKRREEALKILGQTGEDQSRNAPGSTTKGFTFSKALTELQQRLKFIQQVNDGLEKQAEIELDLFNITKRIKDGIGPEREKRLRDLLLEIQREEDLTQVLDFEKDIRGDIKLALIGNKAERDKLAVVLDFERALRVDELNPAIEQTITALESERQAAVDVETTREFLKDVLQESELLLIRDNDAREDAARLLELENDLYGKLTQTQKDNIRAELEAQRVRQRANDIFNEIQQPIKDYERNLQALNQLLKDNDISQDKFNQAIRKNRIAFLESQDDISSGAKRAILKYQDSVETAAQTTERLLTNAFQSAEDAFVKFIETGKLNFSSLIDSIIADLARAAFRQSLAQLLPGGGGIGGGDIFTGLIGGIAGLFSGGGGSIGGPENFQLDFARGGSFKVPGSGGVDSQLVAFHATPGERVTVETPSQQRRSGNTNVTFNINQPVDTDNFRRSQSQLATRFQALIARQARRNG